jgi:OPA family sugar phosphate sensor protein UhpC-like MFS transporter
MLIGVAAVELAHKSAIATSSGFVSCLSYIGAAFAGYPLGLIIQEYGWSGHFTTTIIASLLAVCFLAPLWSTKERPAALAEA